MRLGPVRYKHYDDFHYDGSVVVFVSPDTNTTTIFVTTVLSNHVTDSVTTVVGSHVTDSDTTVLRRLT